MNLHHIVLTLFLILCTTNLASSQSLADAYPEEVYTREKYVPKIDSLRVLCGARKSIPAAFELQTLLAISRYPDLYNARIKFIYRKKVQLPIAARPSMGVLDLLFRFRKGRQYKIVMRVNTPNMMNRTFDEQIGIIGHELAHIQFYRHKSTLGLLEVGFRYLVSRKYRWRFEVDTDLRAIDHGFGNQLMRCPIYVYSSHVKQYMKQKRVQ